MRRIAMAMLLAAGCGGGGGSAIDGTWTAVTASGCILALDFATGNYDEKLVCSLSTGVGVEWENGRFQKGADRINMDPLDDTCVPARNRVPYYIPASFAQNTMVLSFGADAYDLARSAPPAGGVAFTYGCFSDTTGTFIPTPLTPVP